MHDDVNGYDRDDNPAALLRKVDRPLHAKRLASVLKTDTILDDAYFHWPSPSSFVLFVGDGWWLVGGRWLLVIGDGRTKVQSGDV
jgi:hypothetical protein